MADLLLDVTECSYAYPDSVRPAIAEVSLQIHAGEQWSIIGRNGCGKSTLIRCMAGLQHVSRGTIHFAGRPLSSIPYRERARYISYVPQAQGRTIPFTVGDYVMQGRYAYRDLFAAPGAEDKRIVAWALDITETAAFTRRAVMELSGGEAQRVVLAAAVAQQAQLMLLDEPTAFLDPAHEAHFYQTLERIRCESKCTVVTVTHEVNAALTRSTHVLGLRSGGVHFLGNVEQWRERAPGILDELYEISFETFTTQGRHLYSTVR